MNPLTLIGATLSAVVLIEKLNIFDKLNQAGSSKPDQTEFKPTTNVSDNTLTTKPTSLITPSETTDTKPWQELVKPIRLDRLGDKDEMAKMLSAREMASDILSLCKERCEKFTEREIRSIVNPSQPKLESKVSITIKNGKKRNYWLVPRNPKKNYMLSMIKITGVSGTLKDIGFETAVSNYDLKTKLPLLSVLKEGAVWTLKYVNRVQLFDETKFYLHTSTPFKGGFYLDVELYSIAT